MQNETTAFSHIGKIILLEGIRYDVNFFYRNKGNEATSLTFLVKDQAMKFWVRKWYGSSTYGNRKIKDCQSPLKDVMQHSLSSKCALWVTTDFSTLS